jgi:hypothetical protein
MHFISVAIVLLMGFIFLVEDGPGKEDPGEIIRKHRDCLMMARGFYRVLWNSCMLGAWVVVALILCFHRQNQTPFVSIIVEAIAIFCRRGFIALLPHLLWNRAGT